MKNNSISSSLNLMAALICSLGLFSSVITLAAEEPLSSSALQDNLSDRQTASMGQSNAFNSSPLPSSLSSSTSLLPAEEAFKLIVSINSHGQPELHWSIQEGYYLYKEQFSFSVSPPANLISATLPEGEFIHDEFYGDVEIYQHSLSVPLVINQFTTETIPLLIHLQGCAKDLYCYPLQEVPVSIILDPALD